MALPIFLTEMIQATSNSEVFLRPRFSIRVDKNNEAILAALEKELSIAKATFSFKRRDTHIFIDVGKKDSHFWSPHLHIEILEEANQNSEVKGLFSPKPQVWTFFMFLHFLIGLLFLVFATMLYTNSSLEKSIGLPLIMVIMLPIVWVFLYFIGRLGRDFGKKQMQKMQQLLLDSIEKA